MLLVREKTFDTINDGVRELNTILPVYTVLYIELYRSVIEEPTTINTDDIDLSITETDKGFLFEVSFKTDQYLHLTRIFNDRDWIIDYNKCTGLNMRDINMTFNV